jgi:hypothetical protein
MCNLTPGGINCWLSFKYSISSSASAMVFHSYPPWIPATISKSRCPFPNRYTSRGRPFTEYPITWGTTISRSRTLRRLPKLIANLGSGSASTWISCCGVGIHLGGRILAMRGLACWSGSLVTLTREGESLHSTNRNPVRHIRSHNHLGVYWLFLSQCHRFFLLEADTGIVMLG